jgi:hypothetical protein
MRTAINRHLADGEFDYFVISGINHSARAAKPIAPETKPARNPIFSPEKKVCLL